MGHVRMLQQGKGKEYCGLLSWASYILHALVAGNSLTHSNTSTQCQSSSGRSVCNISRLFNPTYLSVKSRVLILATIHHQHQDGLGAVCARHDKPCSVFFKKLQQVAAMLVGCAALELEGLDKHHHLVCSKGWATIHKMCGVC